MLRQRIITALILIAGLLAVIFLVPQSAAALILALLVLAGAWEWAGFAGSASVPARMAYVLAIAVVMALCWWLTSQVAVFHVMLWLSSAWWLVALVWIARFPTRIPAPVTALCGAIVLAPAWVALARLHLVAPDATVNQSGAQWLLFVFVLVWAADIGAYFIGKAIGRAKLAPRVSPGKTWEGVLGGVMASAAVAVVGAWWFQVPTASFVPLCLGVALVSVVGDLTVSMFKRHAGLKDSSDLLPGHGGVLDRIDSIAAAAPVFTLGLTWLKVPV